MLKTLSILEIFTFLFCLSGYIEQDNKAMVVFKIYDVTDCTANNCNAHITQYLKKQKQSGKEIFSDNKRKHENYFSSKIMQTIR